MKQRMPGKDYSEPGYYFCTMVVQGRRPLFGTVMASSEDEQQLTAAAAAQTQGKGYVERTPQDTAALSSPCAAAVGQLGAALSLPCSEAGVLRQPCPPPSSCPFGHGRAYQGACVAYSPFGQIVARLIEEIPTYEPYAGKLEIKGKAVMPDHIHLLLLVKEKMPVPIGTALNGFNIGVRRAWRQLLTDMEQQPALSAAQFAVPQPQDDGKLRIFERGFNDGVVMRAGQLDAYFEYMRLNPRRLLLKQLHPDLFVKTWGKELVPGIRFAMIGNMFLLQRPRRVAVRISRFATDAQGGYLQPRRIKTDEEVQTAIEPYLRAARSGAVLVTPCISPSEKAVVEAAYQESLPVIMFCPYGFSEGYHPSKMHYEACARGILLQLSYLPYDPNRVLTKVLCEQLNDMARAFSTELV